MFDIEAFILNHDYFDALDESEPVDVDVERNTEVLDRIDDELQEADND